MKEKETIDILDRIKCSSVEEAQAVDVARQILMKRAVQDNHICRYCVDDGRCGLYPTTKDLCFKGKRVVEAGDG